MANRKAYSFALEEEEEEDDERDGISSISSNSNGPIEDQHHRAPKRRKGYVFQNSSSSEEEEEREAEPSSTRQQREALLAEEQKRLELEEKAYKQKRRLPELDFVLTFAHRRARAMLELDEHVDDENLRRVFATWLAEIQHRFEDFEKQAARFDELESAMLQSQRKHQVIRKKIAVLVQEERELAKLLADKRVENARRELGRREANKSKALLALMRRA